MVGIVVLFEDRCQCVECSVICWRIACVDLFVMALELPSYLYVFTDHRTRIGQAYLTSCLQLGIVMIVVCP